MYIFKMKNKIKYTDSHLHGVIACQFVHCIVAKLEPFFANHVWTIHRHLYKKGKGKKTE